MTEKELLASLSEVAAKYGDPMIRQLCKDAHHHILTSDLHSKAFLEGLRLGGMMVETESKVKNLIKDQA